MLCKKAPFPAPDGESMVILSDIKALRTAGHKVHVLCLNTEKHYLDTNSYAALNLWDGIEVIEISEKLTLSKIGFALGYNIPNYLARFYREDIADKIHELIERNKIQTLIYQGLAMTQYQQKIPNMRLVYRMHNIESEIWVRLSQYSSSFIKKQLYRKIGQSLKLYETKIWNSMETISLSSREESHINKLSIKKAKSISMSIMDSQIPYSYNPEANGILFVGSLDWKPNQEGLDWFINNIRPLLGDIPVTIAGKGIYIGLKDDGLRIVSNFTHIEELYEQHRLLIVPLKSGSGIRIKIIEALSLGIPVVSTSVGAEGIFEDSTVIAIANTEVGFADKINELYYDQNKCIEMISRMQSYYEQHYSPSLITSQWATLI